MSFAEKVKEAVELEARELAAKQGISFHAAMLRIRALSPWTNRVLGYPEVTSRGLMDKIVAKVKTCSDRHGLNYADATQRVNREHPELMDAFRDVQAREEKEAPKQKTQAIGNLMAQARALQAEEGCSFSDAYRRVIDASPDVAKKVWG